MLEEINTVKSCMSHAKRFPHYVQISGINPENCIVEMKSKTFINMIVEGMIRITTR